MVELSGSRDMTEDMTEEHPGKGLERGSSGEFLLNLYVVDMNLNSIQAIKNIKDICEENPLGRYKINIIDILEHPALARENQIIAAPTLIKEAPMPLKRLVGNMSDTTAHGLQDSVCDTQHYKR